MMGFVFAQLVESITDVLQFDYAQMGSGGHVITMLRMAVVLVIVNTTRAIASRGSEKWRRWGTSEILGVTQKEKNSVLCCFLLKLYFFIFLSLVNGDYLSCRCENK